MAEVSRPPPPKRPTIIRAQNTHDSEKDDDSDMVPRRPVPPTGEGRPPPKPPNRPPSFRKDSHEKKEETEKVQLRHSGNKSSRPVSVGSKADGAPKRKLEITIVSARPMSEVGFRDTSCSNTPSSKLETKKESPKPALKLVPPTSLVPVRDSLPPRPSKPESFPHNRPPPPVPTRKDVPPQQDNKNPTILRAPASPSPKPRPQKSSPESPLAKPRSNVSAPESSPPLKPRKIPSVSSRPLPPTPSPDNGKSDLVIESPAKPQRSYTWSGENESENVSQSSVSDKPRRPTIIRPAKMNKSIEKSQDNDSSKNVISVMSSHQNDSFPSLPIRSFERQPEKEEQKEGKHIDHVNVISKNHIETETHHVAEDEEKKKPPIATKPKPSVLPKPKLKPQANVHTVDDNQTASKDQTELNDFKESLVTDNTEIKKTRKPTIIRANVPKQPPEETVLKKVQESSNKNLEKEIPEYAVILKPAKDKSEIKPQISSSVPSEKPPPPVPSKRFTPLTPKSKDDLEIQRNTDTEKVQHRPKPMARARPMTMVITSSSKMDPMITSKPPPNKPSPPNLTGPSKPPPPAVKQPAKPQSNASNNQQQESPDADTGSTRQEKVPPPRPSPAARPKSMLQSRNVHPDEENLEESKDKPTRPKTGPLRPSHAPVKSPETDSGSSTAEADKRIPTPKEEPGPDLPSRPRPGHPLYHYMLCVPHGQAIHDYDGANPDDLSFKADDIVILHKRIDESWLYGQVGEARGMFPQSFIHILRPFDGEVTPLPSPLTNKTSDSDSSPATSVKEKSDMIKTGPRCVARFDFDGEGAEDLCFEEGDYIQLIERVDSEWVRGDLGGKVGIFPLTFVEVIEDLPDLASDGMNEMVQSEELMYVKETEGTDIRQHEDNLNKLEEKCLMCQAIADFPGESPEDLSFNEGEIIEVITEIDENWMKGRLKNREGIFPASFVIRIDNPSPEITGSPLKHDEDERVEEEKIGEAIYDFDGENDKELSFKTGDQIRLGTRVDGAEDWQWGELNGQTGVFPAAFIQILS
ncbi:SH3 domain-containing protein 19-like isoform X2 [Mytilus californianus]|uniref:SH3 domain-containing protein 19-like isoform X2 n=1 Tax=Mytilus californianus TaxID=6549 RepID=UPI002247B123|nr:SH3 domain-containing protein 19-like isoform X2 [Mytilus californianus]